MVPVIDGDTIDVHGQGHPLFHTEASRAMREFGQMGKYRKVWGDQAAITISDDGFSAGCHCSILVRRVPSRTRWASYDGQSPEMFDDLGLKPQLPAEVPTQPATLDIFRNYFSKCT